MINKLKKLYKLTRVEQRYCNQRSFAQEGEDLVLARIFDGQNTGFYVDIGAHHPFRFSNTFLFYNKGWRGLNVDATPGSMKPFERYRKDDINVECAVSVNSGKNLFYVFNDPALNTIDRVKAEELMDGENDYYLVDKIELVSESINNLFEKYVPENKRIDFLTLDVEGFDAEIIQSLDIEKYRPKVILYEDVGGTIESTSQSQASRFLIQNGYRYFARTFNTNFFIID